MSKPSPDIISRHHKHKVGFHSNFTQIEILTQIKPIHSSSIHFDFSELSRNLKTSDLILFTKMAGQSDPHVSLFSPPEVEFMAEDELVEIVPNMRMDPLNFICGDFGPFYPQIPVKVPLWLAAALKKRGKCTIRPPQWMSIENLTKVLEGEREDRGIFQAVPFHYIEISRLLFDHARDDIPDIYMVRSLIEDIRDVRLHKIETNLEKFSATSAVKIAHLSAMEVNVVRPFVVRALQAFYKHDNPVLMVDLDSVSDRQSHVTRQRQLPNNAQKQPLKRR